MRLAPSLLCATLFSALLAAPLAAGDQPAGAGAGRGDGEGGRLKELLAKFDTNHDGKLDEGERAAARTAYAAKIKENHPELFAKIDTDGDGTLSEAEMKAAREKLKELREQHPGKPGNGGKPDPAELSARIKANHPELFAKLDTNGDGTLSLDELKAGKEKLKELREKRGDHPEGKRPAQPQ